MTVFVVSVYMVVVRGAGAMLGSTESPSLPLSVLATATVALSFARVQDVVERCASTLARRRTAQPYDVLHRFSPTELPHESADELVARMARLLAEGTGAEWAQVWVRVSGQLTLAAAFPSVADATATPPALQDEARDATGAGRRALVVTHGGEALGVLRLQERPGLTLTPVERRLFTALADRAGLMLRLVGVRADLESRHEELALRAQELKASRERLIVTQDAERRRLERDLHDGAQQHLVALTVNLRLAQTLAATSPVRAAELTALQAGAASVAIETLASRSRGIYPRLLAEQGLVAALRSAVATSAIPVDITAERVERLPADVEAALYFCCMEAVQNAAKHSGADTIEVHVSHDTGRSRLVVTDDGVGLDRGRDDTTGRGLANMRDRLDAVGGSLTMTSTTGAGTTVAALVPDRST
jgi:signal transduction histidine kinase